MRLRLKPKRTMSLAQGLYEGIEMGDAGHQGLITYMRTDSTRISDEAQAAVKEYIRADAWQGVHRRRARAEGQGERGANVQDAHEAIRPTDVTITPERVKPFLTPDQHKLYQLIWRRFVAAFMAPAVFDTLRVDISAGDLPLPRQRLDAQASPASTPSGRVRSDADALPALDARATRWPCSKLEPAQHFTQPPPRFTEASLIKELEERGIGRPSTFVSIVTTIQDRGYVEQQERRFVPTWLGETVNDLMRQALPGHRRRQLHRRDGAPLDSVEEGKQVWTQFLTDFYAELRDQLEARRGRDGQGPEARRGAERGHARNVASRC